MKKKLHMIGVTGLEALGMIPNTMQLYGLKRVARGYHNDPVPLMFIDTRTMPVNVMVHKNIVSGIMVLCNLRSHESL